MKTRIFPVALLAALLLSGFGVVILLSLRFLFWDDARVPDAGELEKYASERCVGHMSDDLRLEIASLINPVNPDRVSIRVLDTDCAFHFEDSEFSNMIGYGSVMLDRGMRYYLLFQLFDERLLVGDRPTFVAVPRSEGLLIYL